MARVFSPLEKTSPRVLGNSVRSGAAAPRKIDLIVANHHEHDQRDPALIAETNYSDRKDANVPKNVSAYP